MDSKLQYEVFYTRAKVEEIKSLAGHFKKGLLLIDEFNEAVDNVLESLKDIKQPE